MNPILYEANETNFQTNGIGRLPDAITCLVTEARNGEYELMMEYPVTGVFFEEIQKQRFIKAKPNETSDPQPFRIYQISTPMNGVVTIDAEHRTYDLNYIPVEPFSATNAAAALQGMVNNSAIPHNFTVWTDMQTGQGNFSVGIPSSFRSRLGGNEGSILDVWGGEYEFDNNVVKLHAQRGADNGVEILYGKNLIDIRQEENIASAVTGIYPFWKGKEDGELVRLPEKVIKLQSTNLIERVVPVDFSGSITDQPTEAQLRQAATSYISQNKIDQPRISITVDFVQLWQTVGYEDIASLERVRLCDTVTVRFEKMGINVKAKVVKTVFNAITERYELMELGDAVTNLGDTILLQQRELEKAPSTSMLEQAIQRATNAITGASGGHVRLNPSENPQEILVMDKDKLEEALRIWRWNLGGLGYSKNGYNGPFGLAMTMNGEIVADFITTGTLNAALVTVQNLNAASIIAGILQSVTGGTFFNLDTGVISCTQGDVGVRMQNGRMDYTYQGSNTITISGGRSGTSTGFISMADPAAPDTNRAFISPSFANFRDLTVEDTLYVQKMAFQNYQLRLIKDPNSNNYYLGV